MSDNSEFLSKTLRDKVGHMRSFIDPGANEPQSVV